MSCEVYGINLTMFGWAVTVMFHFILENIVENIMDLNGVLFSLLLAYEDSKCHFRI